MDEMFGIALIVLISCAFVLGILGLISWTIVNLVGGGRRASSTRGDEARLIQELYHGLSRMEQRVESLETLLIERDKKARP